MKSSYDYLSPWLAASLLLPQLTTILAAASEHIIDETPCGLYLAPSSIPGAGLGLFAGDQPIRQGDVVGGTGDISIPIVEFRWHNKDVAKREIPFLMDEYSWPVTTDIAGSTGIMEEVEENLLIQAATFGVGAISNGHATLENTRDVGGSTQINRAIKGGPGVGAISPFYGRSFSATKFIPSGAEIFLNNGDDHNQAHTYGDAPSQQDYQSADSLLEKMQSMERSLAPPMSGSSVTSSGESGDNIGDDLWSVVTSHIRTWEAPRILNALPSKWTQAGQVLQAGGTGQQHFNHSIRDLSWLKENGQCMDDKIKFGQSQIPDAGRGAFASRFISKGALVAPAPLVHIPDSDVLKMFLDKDGEMPGTVDPRVEGPFTHQLLMNYCFGHEQSSLLLCPQGQLTGYINHSSKQPNTRIKWSSQLQHPEWKQLPVESWGGERHTGLAFDFVALRDIDEDEEILIDYGGAWEKAWEKHTREYIPRDHYMPAYEMNELDDIEYRTVEARDYEADGVSLLCRHAYLMDLEDEDTECRILKNLGNDRYMVQLVYWDDCSYEGFRELEEGDILFEVPSDAFYFADLPYSRDHHQFNGFRHPMMIPDDIFPDGWQNSLEGLESKFNPEL